MAKKGKRVRLAAITPTLDWSHRQRTSNERFDLTAAREYIESHLRLCFRLMAEAAVMGADLVLGPEYFRGSELFTTTPENQRLIVETAEGPTVQRMRELSKKRGVCLAAAMAMLHDGGIAETGVLTGRKGELAGIQVKNTSVPEDSPLRCGYKLFDLDIGKVGIFTCSDLTNYPEDTIPLAKAGMQIVLVPGCGFAGHHWKSYLTVRALDLSCVVVHADGGRASIVNSRGEVLAETNTNEAIIYANVVIEPKEPVTRLRCLLG